MHLAQYLRQHLEGACGSCRANFPAHACAASAAGAGTVALKPVALGADDRLLDRQDGVGQGLARHELLRALVLKIPAQVRENTIFS